jgi:hypothetical protein
MSDDPTFDDGDPFDDPLWKQAELIAGAPPRPAKGYVTCSLAWLARVLPVVRTPGQLAVALLLYRWCRMLHCCTVALPNGELGELGVSRQTKYRTLAHLEEAGAVTVETCHGRAARVTLHWFP